MRKAAMLLLTVALCALSSASASERLVEKDITFKLLSRANDGGDDVPVVDPPSRCVQTFASPSSPRLLPTTKPEDKEGALINHATLYFSSG